MAAVRVLFAPALAVAQKPGGVLHAHLATARQHVDPRGSDDLDRRADDGGVQQPRHVRPAQPQNSLDSIVPDLAESWSWSEDGKTLTFKLRAGVKWHDGKPFTAKTSSAPGTCCSARRSEVPINPRSGWYWNLTRLTVNGDHEAIFHLKRPQPAFSGAARFGSIADLSLPCVAGADAAAPDRHRAVQVRRVQAERVDQGGEEPGLLETGPALSRRHRIHDHPEPLDRVLGFVAGKFDMTFPTEITVPLMQDIAQPGAERDLRADARPMSAPTCSINRDKPPFDNAELRRAMALTLDRKAFIDILYRGQGGYRRRDAAAAGRGVGHAGRGTGEAARLRARTWTKNRAEAREIMKKLGYGPEKHLPVKVADPQYPAISRPGGDPDRPAEGNLHRRRARRGRDRQLVPEGDAQGLQVGLKPDRQLGRRPRPAFYENYACGSRAQLQRLLQQRRSTSWSTSSRPRPTRKSASRWSGRSTANCSEDGARPIIFTPAAPPAGSRSQGPDHDGQQHLQRLAPGGRLAGEIRAGAARITARSAGVFA